MNGAAANVGRNRFIAPCVSPEQKERGSEMISNGGMYVVARSVNDVQRRPYELIELLSRANWLFVDQFL